jgi:cystathionine gamma-synthase
MPDHLDILSLETRLLHAGERAAAPAATPTTTPIYPSTTYIYPDLAALDQAFASGEGYMYTRYGNPTVVALETALSAIEGGRGAVVYGSGMAALHAALLAASTPRGETAARPQTILAARDLYGSTTVLLDELFAARGSTVVTCDMCDLKAFEASLAEHQPAVVLVEQISNPLLRVIDIPALATRCKAAGARLIVDSTIATPILQRPLALGADLVVHSATKYISGHGDAAGGAVVARTTLLHDTLVRQSRLLGASLGPFEAQQILRGAKTLALRIERQCSNAAQIAAILADHPAVEQVNYPGLPSHPQHQLAGEAFAGRYGAMISFTLRNSEPAALHRFVDSLRIFLPATSLGDIYSLVTVPAIASHRDLSAEQRAARGISDTLVRLSVGIEAAEDLIADLRDALAE